MAISSRNNQPTDEELLGELTKKLGNQLRDQLLRVSNKIYGKTSKAASIVVSSEVADLIKKWL
jgi:hypothetical protein